MERVRPNLERSDPPADSRPPLPAASCPFLGTVDDARTHALFPTPQHRCALRPRRRLAPDWQRSYCLGAAHGRCPYFSQQAASSAPTQPRPARRRQILLISVLVGVATLGSIGAASAILGSPARRGAELGTPPVSVVVATIERGAPLAATSPSATSAPATATPPPPPTATPRPTHTPTPRPTPTRTPPATATATLAPTATLPPTPPASPTAALQVYVVQPGDTIELIAARYGTTTAVLIELNQLADPDLLIVGQELRVPATP